MLLGKTSKGVRGRRIGRGEILSKSEHSGQVPASAWFHKELDHEHHLGVCFVWRPGNWAFILLHNHSFGIGHSRISKLLGIGGKSSNSVREALWRDLGHKPLETKWAQAGRWTWRTGKRDTADLGAQQQCQYGDGTAYPQGSCWDVKVKEMEVKWGWRQLLSPFPRENDATMNRNRDIQKGSYASWWKSGKMVGSVLDTEGTQLYFPKTHYLEEFPSDAKALTLCELKATEMLVLHFTTSIHWFLFSPNVYLSFTHEGDRNKALLNTFTYSEETCNWTAMFYCY